MTYTKLTLTDGTILKAEHLNHIEDGIVGNEEAIASANTLANNSVNIASNALTTAEAANTNAASAVTTASDAYDIAEEAKTTAQGKQNALESGVNIKTINGESLLGEGDITIEADVDLDSKQDKLISGTNIKTINGESLLGSGNITINASSDETKWYLGKKCSILGDSISTFNGYNPDDERKPTYPSGTVNSWTLTWWGRIIEKLGLELAMNDSWSGSNVYNSYTTDSPSANVGPNVCMAGLKRIQNLSANGTPDIIFFFGGTNDVRFIKSGGTKLGSFDETADYSTVDLEAITWTTFVDAYVAAIMRLQYYYPNAFIVAMTPMFATASAWNSQEDLQKLCVEVSKICNYFGVHHLDMRKCGIKMTNASKFLKDGLHPDKIGMQLMGDYLISVLEPILAKFANVGATEPEISTLEQLKTPTLSISENGLASWTAIENASAYGYSIDGANAVETTELNVQLTEGQSIKVKAIGDGTTYSDSDFSETKTYTTTTDPIILATPNVTISGTGLASWTAIDGASSYAYIIDGGNAVATNELSVQLTNGQSIQVMAVGDGTNYTNSEYSEVQTYTEIDVDIPTETTWYVDFTSEPVNYNYSAQTQGAVTFSNQETIAKCQGVAINAIKVHVGNAAVMGVVRVLSDGDSFEPICDVTLTGGTTTGSESTPAVFKLTETIVLGEDERLGVVRNIYPSGGPYASIWVSTNSSNDLAKVHTNIRGLGIAKDESWKLPIAIGYVVD